MGEIRMRYKRIISFRAFGKNEIVVVRKWLFYVYITWSICADIFLVSGLIYYFFMR
ncbi:uncharacterized protein METZ01_LOCUS408335 [marine metagenome]|uniref:Uncharacterized protein n=1 Tax=marine metagenome TaxID=408172 RepID=A0A382WBG0_9ZZZZ